MALLCLYGLGQENTAKPLTIGDAVPDIAFSNLYNYPSKTARLSDFKGKLVILDFWGSSCVPCIHTLLKLDSLQKQFAGEIQAIGISDFTNVADQEKLLKRFTNGKSLAFPTLINKGGPLADYFPHKIVSHLVWINQYGVVAAITGSDYVTAANVKQLLADQTVNWSVKKEVEDFNYNLPLLGLTNTGIEKPEFIFYSTLTAHLEGVSSPSGTFTDTLHNTTSTRYYNTTLLELCKLALGYPSDSSIYFNVKDISRYKWMGKGLRSDWARANTYCYSILLPGGLTDTQLRNAIRADVLRWLNMLGVNIITANQIQSGVMVPVYTITDKVF